MSNLSPKQRQLRRKKRAIRKIKQILWTISAISLSYVIGFQMGNTKPTPTQPTVITPPTIEREENETQPVKKALDAVKVDAPKDYTKAQAIQKLNSFVEDERYANIIAHTEEYPESLLKNLANNPEMISFVANYNELKQNPQKASMKQEEINAACPLFLQWDERWGAISYGDDSNIAISGCGPTALSMVIAGLTANQEATPDQLASFAMKKGYYLSGTGTKWSLMTEGAAEYGLASRQIESSQMRMQQSLDEGGFLICSMKKGDFTINGHFIVIYDYDSDGFKINDPFCIYRSQQSWAYDDIKNQIKNAWALKKK